MKHADFVANEWHDGRQRVLFRVQVSDEKWWRNSEWGRNTLRPFDGSYAFLTDLHDEAECPWPDGTAEMKSV